MYGMINKYYANLPNLMTHQVPNSGRDGHFYKFLQCFAFMQKSSKAIRNVNAYEVVCFCNGRTHVRSPFVRKKNEKLTIFAAGALWVKNVCKNH